MRLLFILVSITILTEARKKRPHKIIIDSSSDEELERIVSKKTRRKQNNPADPFDHFNNNEQGYNEQLAEELEIESYVKSRVQNKTIQEINLNPPDHLQYNAIEPLYLVNSFDSEPKTQDNWTTCEEFGHNAHFQPKSIMDVDWIPFYTWSLNGALENVAYVHTFSIPSTKMVQKYKNEMGRYLNKSLEWEGDHLYMNSDLNMLLLAGNWIGEYNGISYTEVPKTMKRIKLSLPIINLRLKEVDKYLAMMFCDHHYATIMAIAGSEPSTVDEIRSEAAKLKFKGRGEFPIIKQSEQLKAKYEEDVLIQIPKEEGAKSSEI